MNGFQTGSRAVIRTFPFAHLWLGFIHIPFGRDAPEPVAMHIIHDVAFDEIPDAPGGFEKSR